MNKKRIGLVYVIKFSALIFFLISQTSCLNTKRLTYFPELRDSTFKLVNNNFEPIIQKGDILYIAVTSADLQSAVIFNSVNAIGVQNGANVFPVVTTPGIVVDPEGKIELPKIGQIIAVGKTKKHLISELQDSLRPYLKDVVVTIRFMNYRVTVLGEVNRPQVVTTTNERITIFEALASCNDMTAFGKRENVLLIRDNKGIQETHRINLGDNSLFKTPYYYLQSNDVIYVEPNKAKAFTSTYSFVLLPTIISSLGFLVIILDRVFK